MCQELPAVTHLILSALTGTGVSDSSTDSVSKLACKTLRHRRIPLIRMAVNGNSYALPGRMQW